MLRRAINVHQIQQKEVSIDQNKEKPAKSILGFKSVEHVDVPVCLMTQKAICRLLVIMSKRKQFLDY